MHQLATPPPRISEMDMGWVNPWVRSDLPISLGKVGLRVGIDARALAANKVAWSVYLCVGERPLITAVLTNLLFIKNTGIIAQQL